MKYFKRKSKSVQTTYFTTWGAPGGLEIMLVQTAQNKQLLRHIFHYQNEEKYDDEDRFEEITEKEFMEFYEEAKQHFDRSLGGE